MKIITNQQPLNKKDIFDLIFLQEEIQIDQSYESIFSNEKDIKFLQLECIQQIQEEKNQKHISNLIQKNKKGLESLEIFERAILVFTLITLLKSKQKVRGKLINYLIVSLNSKTKFSQLVQSPFSLPLMFYGESQQSALIQKLEDLPLITQKELDFIYQNLSSIYFLSLAYVIAENLKAINQIQVVSFSLYCEVEGLNTDFLQLFAEKTSMNRKISFLASSIQNLLTLSKLSKQQASQEVIKAIEINGIQLNQIEQGINFIVEDLYIDEQERLDSLKIKGGFTRDFDNLNNIFRNIYFQLFDQIQNVLQRTLNSKEPLVSEQTQQITQLKQIEDELRNFQVFNGNFMQKTKFGDEIPFILEISSLVSTQNQIVKIEALLSLLVLNQKQIKNNQPSQPKQQKEVAQQEEGKEKPQNQKKPEKQKPEKQKQTTENSDTQQSQQQTQESSQQEVAKQEDENKEQTQQNKKQKQGNNKKVQEGQEQQQNQEEEKQQDTKQAKIKEDKKKVVANRNLQLGKGTQIIFNDFLQLLSELTDQQSVDATFNKYFSEKNSAFLEKIEELCSNKNEERRIPKIPKGTRDFDPKQTKIRSEAIDVITKVFKRFGAVEIDTPVFELKETLTGKYGADSKLIYDLDDQGGELYSLRYDLTVPFARYLATKNIQNIKRYHIAKVYRRDRPNVLKGRYREFYQCDFDIAGIYDSMIPDAEVLSVINQILIELNIEIPFKIKVNNRKILDAMIQIAGAPSSKFKQICSSIDKLDKEPWSEVKKELIHERGLTQEQTDILGKFVQYSGRPQELLKRIQDENLFQNNAAGLQGLKEMEQVFEYLNSMKQLDNIQFDLSLARGLDYYTGLIFEAVLEGSQIGSISGGGRYDNLVGMFSQKQIPSVGGSIGIERIFTIIEQQQSRQKQKRQNETEVLVCSIGGGLLNEKLKIVQQLRDLKINTEYLYKEKVKPQNQIEYALDNYIPFMIWIGEEEINTNMINLKTTYLKHEEKVQREQMASVLQQKIKQYYEDLANNKVIYEESKGQDQDDQQEQQQSNNSEQSQQNQKQQGEKQQKNQKKKQGKQEEK